MSEELKVKCIERLKDFKIASLSPPVMKVSIVLTEEERKFLLHLLESQLFVKSQID